jgi:hypothetical protein
MRQGLSGDESAWSRHFHSIEDIMLDDRTRQCAAQASRVPPSISTATSVPASRATDLLQLLLRSGKVGPGVGRVGCRLGPPKVWAPKYILSISI